MDNFNFDDLNLNDLDLFDPGNIGIGNNDPIFQFDEFFNPGEADQQLIRAFFNQQGDPAISAQVFQQWKQTYIAQQNPLFTNYQFLPVPPPFQGNFFGIISSTTLNTIENLAFLFQQGDLFTFYISYFVLLNFIRAGRMYNTDGFEIDLNFALDGTIANRERSKYRMKYKQQHVTNPFVTRYRYTYRPVINHIHSPPFELFTYSWYRHFMRAFSSSFHNHFFQSQPIEEAGNQVEITVELRLRRIQLPEPVDLNVEGDALAFLDPNILFDPIDDNDVGNFEPFDNEVQQAMQYQVNNQGARNRRYPNIPQRRNIPYTRSQVPTTRSGTRYNFRGEKMFFQNTSDTQKKIQNVMGLGENPIVEEGLCFPMAFLTSQIRWISLTAKSIHENSPVPNVSIPPLAGNRYVIIPWENPHRDFQFSSFCNQNELYIGNPTTPSRYVLPLWKSAAIFLESYVQSKYWIEIPRHTWTGMVTAFAEVFKVIIHVYEENISQRRHVFTYSNWKEDPVHGHLYLYVKDQHIYPVQKIRKFLCPNNNQGIMGLCDYCQFVQQQSARTCWNHIEKCIETGNLVSKTLKTFAERFQNLDPFYRYQLTNFSAYYHGVNTRLFRCNTCLERVYPSKVHMGHSCKMLANKNTPEELIKNRLNDDCIFVLDMESMQNKQGAESEGLYSHECVLICVQPVYNPNPSLKKAYWNIHDFINELRTSVYYDGATFLAHNGGGYDYHFIIVEWEKRGWTYYHIPRPSSKHKYLEIILINEKGNEIRFIDFMMLVPESLRSIGESFHLPIQKGDFPHRFLNSTTLEYIGSFPPLYSPEDYFSHRSRKSVKDQEELVEWHTEQCSKYCDCGLNDECRCTKPKWNCRLFLEQYCWIDVEVLSQACRLYRNLLLQMETTVNCGGWQSIPIDPFKHITQSQIAMNMFVQGYGKNLPFVYVPKTPRPDFHAESICWIKQIDPFAEHVGTTGDYFYFPQSNFFVDGWNARSKTIYIYQDCRTWGCPHCYPEENKLFTKRSVYFNEIPSDYRVVKCWHHEKQNQFSSEELEEGQVYQDREIFYGGRTEVFSPYANAEKLGKKIADHDVCSLYPYVCSFKPLPIGKPTFFYGSKIVRSRLSPLSSNPYFGFAKCKVRCPKKELIGLLPTRAENERLVFDLNDKIGFWHTEEIYLAMEHGYVIEKIYQVIHFEKEQVSTTFMRGYMEHFLRIKQESEGWKKLGASSDDPEEGEKNEIVEQLFQSNGEIAKIRKEKVHKNPVLRKIAKIFLNCLWGKFCQHLNSEFCTEISSYHEYEYLLDSVGSDNLSLRNFGEEKMRAYFDLSADRLRPNKRYNIFIAASVTAHARCILHRQMFNVGPENVLYCDTDSLRFLCPVENGDHEWTGVGLGKWTDELGEEKIRAFYAIAPKFYCDIFEDNSQIIKSKGVWLTQENKGLLTEEKFQDLIFHHLRKESREGSACPVYLKNMTIYPNAHNVQFPYGKVFTRYNQKIVQCVYSKRCFMMEGDEIDFEKENFFENIARLHLVPFGYTP